MAEFINLYLEGGKIKTFAVAIDWPGWVRSSTNEEAAIQRLLDYAPRYQKVMTLAGLPFEPPLNTDEFTVTLRQQGNAATDFGVADLPIPGDDEAVDETTLKRFVAILQACWQAFDLAVETAGDAPLTKGPRGGGRDTEKIISHMYESDAAYIGALGKKFKMGNMADARALLTEVREEALAVLAQSVNGEIPAFGPRGGRRWTPRYFVRRLAWHQLDHTWEIEDRSQN